MIIALLAACATEDKTDELQAGRDALAAELWGEIEGYESWDQVDPWTGYQPSADGTHGEYVQIWLNDEAVASYEDDSAATGSVLVKKGYADPEGADPYGNLTVMLKPEDTTSVPATGWLWVSFASDGTFSKAEDDAGCAGCHASGSDYRRMVVDVPGGG